MLPFICIFFTFFLQCHNFSSTGFFTSLVKIILKYFFLCDAYNFWWNQIYLFLTFAAFVFGLIFKNPLLGLRSWKFTPMPSTMSFMVLASIFPSWIHFELILYMVSSRVGRSKFILLHVAVHLLDILLRVWDKHLEKRRSVLEL